MNFAEIQDKRKAHPWPVDAWPVTADDVDWLLSHLIKERARAMEAEYSFRFTIITAEKYRDGVKVSITPTDRDGWTPADWEREAERELREETGD